MKVTKARILLLGFGLMAVFGAGCGNKDAANTAPPPAPPPGAAAVPAGLPPEAAAGAAQQKAGMEAQKRMNDEMARARQAAEQGKK